jgi:hypothetical protein
MSEGPVGREVNIPEELVLYFVQARILPKVINSNTGLLIIGIGFM